MIVIWHQELGKTFEIKNINNTIIPKFFKTNVKFYNN